MLSVSDFAVESDVWPHIASPGQGLQGGWPSRLDFCCKVTTKIFGTWLCCHLLSFISRYSVYITHVYSALWTANIFLRGAGPIFVFRRSVTRETNIRRWGNAYVSWWYQISISVTLRTLLQSYHPIYELIEELLPDETVKVTIAEQPDGSRLVTMER